MVGFNGTVDITWAAVARMMSDKLNAGAPCAATSHRLETTVGKEISTVDVSRGKPCFTGHMIQERFNYQHARATNAGQN